MQVNVNSANITTFRVGLEFDIYNRTATFSDMSTYAGSSGNGRYNVLGISFLLKDQEGVQLASIDFSDASKYILPSAATEFVVDLSSMPYVFLFQTYQIQAAIKDADGTIYYTDIIYKKICQPQNLTEAGYVPGIFQVNANCTNSVLTVKELTALVYNNAAPASTTKTGTLSYPTGTISAVSFAGTPFSNNTVYTGEYRVNCTTVSEYDQEDDVTVLVTYLTNNVFKVTCENKIADLICCMVDLQTTYRNNCENAKGRNAKQKLDEITIPFLLGLTKEINGQDASTEADIIKKSLNCDCGATSTRQSEFTPINPSTTNIVITGVGGTTVPSPTVDGNTQTYAVQSNLYQVVKGVAGDLGFTIETDTSTANVVKYKITLNYSNIALSILNAIGSNPSLVSLLNSLISSTGGVSLSGLNGKCIIDLTDINYLLTQNINSNTKVTGISTIDTNYAAPANLYASDTASVKAWLDGLGIGTFTITGGSTSIGVLSLANSFNLSSMTFTDPTETVIFQSTNATLVTVLQAIIDYLCNVTALQMQLGATLTLWQIDYNGSPINSSLISTQSQAALNQSIAESIYNIVQYLATLTGITCAKISAIFADSPTLSIGANSRMYGVDDDGNCTAWNHKQIALAVISAINSYSDVKTAYCAIDCGKSAICPDIQDIKAGGVSGAISIYAVAWDITPTASQSVKIEYKLNSSDTWITATSSLTILPNGNVQNSPPYLISGLDAGYIYDLRITNNCGGVGFTMQVTIPSAAVYSGAYSVENSLYLICGKAEVIFYTATPFGSVGQVIFTDSGLTTPLTGYTYIVGSDNQIWEINPLTGQLVINTGNTCDTGVANVILVGNNTGTICGANIATGYTNGAFTPGGVIYSDSSLTTPLTGYSYVVNTANNAIYNLNSTTGIIGSATGLNCTSYSKSFKRSNSEGTICSASSETLYSASAFAAGVTLYTDAALTTIATGYQYVQLDQTYDIYNMNATTGLVGSLTGNNCLP